MKHNIDIRTYAKKRASKSYSLISGVSFVHEGNLLLRDTNCEYVEKAQTVKSDKNKNCSNYSEEIFQDYVYKDLDSCTKNAVKEHISECSTCRNKVGNYFFLKQASSSLGKNSLSSDVKQRLHNRLKKELNLSKIY